MVLNLILAIYHRVLYICIGSFDTIQFLFSLSQAKIMRLAQSLRREGEESYAKSSLVWIYLVALDHRGTGTF